ncbi:MAG: DUF5667 domain-containing protein [bacterium]
MTNKEILKKLKSVNEVNPNERWVSKNRSVLLLQIKESCPAVEHKMRGGIFAFLKLNFGFFLDTIIPQRFAENFARPLAVSFVGLMIVISSMAAMGMSQKTAPGNILYPLKIIGENVQLSFAKNIEDKARLEIEFAGRRMGELNKLVTDDKLSSANLEEKINKVTVKLKNNIRTANVHLAELDISGDAYNALKVAKEIDKKVSEYAAALNKINKTAAANPKMADALSTAEEASDKALEVIVAKHKKDDGQDGISDSDIAEKLNNKIASAIIDIDSEKNLKIENQELDQTFQDARDLIQTGDFAAALNKITEGKDIIKELRAKMEEEEKQKQEDANKPADEVDTTEGESVDGEESLELEDDKAGEAKDGEIGEAGTKQDGVEVKEVEGDEGVKDEK